MLKCIVFAVCLSGTFLVVESKAQARRPVVIDYFYEPGCAECETVSRTVLPKLEESYKGTYLLRKWDTGIKTNYIRLVHYQEKLGVEGNESVSMVVDKRHILEGASSIQKRLLPIVGECLQTRLASEDDESLTEDVLMDRFRSFRSPAVALAGLIDGINPCAIGTLIFFMSLLAVSKVRGSRLLCMGASFCAASFLTYTVIGFGLLHLFRSLSGFTVIRQVVEIIMIAFLSVLAFLSLRDALRYRKTGDAHDVTLQIPGRVKEKIHTIMRKGVKTRHLILGGFLVGALVTALESVCTGQVYLPTLVLVAETGGSDGAKAWRYLLLYNVMFIVPLTVVFGVTLFGVSSQQLVEWSKKHVVVSKVLMAVLFLTMISLMIVL